MLVGKTRKVCQKLKFDHTNKWYMHNPESVLENETRKILWEFKIQTDHLISAKRPDLGIVNKKRKKNLPSFAVSAYHLVKLKENEKKDKNLDLARELKKTMEHESDSDTNCNWCTWHSHKRISTGTVWLRNKNTSRDHSNYSIVEITLNTEKSPGDLRRLVVTQTTVINYELTLVWKTPKWVNNNDNNKPKSWIDACATPEKWKSYRGDYETYCNRCPWNNPQLSRKVLDWTRDSWKNWNPTGYSTSKIGSGTKESP